MVVSCLIVGNRTWVVTESSFNLNIVLVIACWLVFIAVGVIPGIMNHPVQNFSPFITPPLPTSPSNPCLERVPMQRDGSPPLQGSYMSPVDPSNLDCTSRDRFFSRVQKTNIQPTFSTLLQFILRPPSYQHSSHGVRSILSQRDDMKLPIEDRTPQEAQ